jgi:hypothetical protein
MKQTQLVVEYGGTIKVAQAHNRFENVDMSYGVTETYTVEDEDEFAIAAFREERMKALSQEVGDELVNQYNLVKEGQLGTPDND